VRLRLGQRSRGDTCVTPSNCWGIRSKSGNRTLFGPRRNLAPAPRSKPRSRLIAGVQVDRDDPWPVDFPRRGKLGLRVEGCVCAPCATPTISASATTLFLTMGIGPDAPILQRVAKLGPQVTMRPTDAPTGNISRRERFRSAPRRPNSLIRQILGSGLTGPLYNCLRPPGRFPGETDEKLT